MTTSSTTASGFPKSSLVVQIVNEIPDKRERASFAREIVGGASTDGVCFFNEAHPQVQVALKKLGLLGAFVESLIEGAQQLAPVFIVDLSGLSVTAEGRLSGTIPAR